MGEDSVFSIKAYAQADIIIELPNYYGYICTTEHENKISLSHGRSKDRFIEYYKSFLHIKDYLNEINLNNEQSWSKCLPFLLFMFLKVKANKEEKISMLKTYRDFVLSLNCPNIKLKLKPLDMLNNDILNEQYTKVIFLSSITNKFYDCEKLYNFLFKHMYGLKKRDYPKLL